MSTPVLPDSFAVSGEFGAIIDTCSLFPYLTRSLLFCTAKCDFYRVHWFEKKILEELRKKLVRRGATSNKKINRLVDRLCAAFPNAIVPCLADLVNTMTNDPKDRHVLAAAVYGRCDVIVTENTQDFPLESTDPYKIRCLLQTNFVRSIPV